MVREDPLVMVALEERGPNCQVVLAKIEFSSVKVMKEIREQRLETEFEVALQAEEAEEVKEALCLL